MKAVRLFSFLVLTVLMASATLDSSDAQDQDDEHPQIAHSSDAFEKTIQTSIKSLSESGFANGLSRPSVGASANQQYEKQRDLIKKELPIEAISEGNRGVKYDVILQPGHYGRPPDAGPRGTAGADVTERALATYITNEIVKKLREDHLNVLVVSANKYLRPTAKGAAFDGLQTKVFLAIHANGGEPPCSGKAGPSLGYKSDSSLYGMHTLGFSLSAAMGYAYKDFSRDNYTVNEAQYYMFNQVKADRLAGLLEVGELTCPDSEKRLIAASKRIGDNVAHAIDFIVRTNGPM